MDYKTKILHYWPVFTSVWFLLTFIICYFVALYTEHVYYLFPYISDAGSLPPESCIFGQMLNLGALFMFVTMFIRFKVVRLLRHRGSDEMYAMWNNWSNLFGLLSCFGMSLVANFQETSVLIIHFFGAFLAFAVGAVYCIMHAYLTWLSYSNKILKCTRILLSFLVIPLYITTSVCSSISFQVFDGKTAFKWKDDDEGYPLHLVATFTEWLMAIVLTSFVATYYVEFKLVEFDEISVILKH